MLAYLPSASTRDLSGTRWTAPLGHPDRAQYPENLTEDLPPTPSPQKTGRRQAYLTDQVILFELHKKKTS
jgi:hypothetical protein